MATTPKLSFDYRKFSRILAQRLMNNSVVVLAVTLLIVSFLILQRINAQTDPTLDQAYLNKQITELQQVKFDEEAVNRIKELNSTSIEITSNFADRNNPFQDN